MYEANSRRRQCIIRGRPFGVGFDCWYQHLHRVGVGIMIALRLRTSTRQWRQQLTLRKNPLLSSSGLTRRLTNARNSGGSRSCWPTGISQSRISRPRNSRRCASAAKSDMAAGQSFHLTTQLRIHWHAGRDSQARLHECSFSLGGRQAVAARARCSPSHS